MPVICVGSTKGGVGKSTICVNIAVSAARRNTRVMLIDTDKRQNSSLSWRAQRAADDITACSIPGPTLHRDIPKIKENFDLVIIDAGGRDDAMFRSAMLASDILLIPVLPSKFDVYAAEDTIALLREVNGVRATDLTSFFLLNQFQDRTNVSRATQEALDIHRDIVPLLKTKLHFLTAYKNCLDSGVGVVELKGAGRAAGEVDYLVQILGLLPNKQPL